MNLVASAAVAAFAIHLFVALFALLRDRKRPLNQIFFLSGCCSAALALGVFALSQPLRLRDADAWARMLMACAALTPALFLHVTTLLFGPARRGVLRTSYAAACVLTVLALAGGINGGVRAITTTPEMLRWYPSGTWGTAVLFLYATCAVAYSLTLLVRAIRHSHGIRRAQAYYFAVGIVPYLLAGAHDAAGMYLFTYPRTEVTILPFGPLATAFWSALVGYTILRYRLVDLDEAITRGVVRTVASAVLAVPCFLLLLAAQKAYHGEVQLDFSLLIFAICTLAAVIVPRLSAAAERRIGAAVLGRSRHYREALVAFSQEAARILDLKRLVERMCETLTTALGVSAAAVYVAEPGKGWRLTGQRGCYLPRLPESLHERDALVAWLQERREPAVREELQIETESGRSPLAVVVAMSQIGAEVAVPLRTPEALEGIILLAARTDGVLFTQEDLAVLTILGNQLATALANARLYADLEHSRELIQRNERLSAIGTMAAGLAHEIRNPLVSIRTFTQLLPERLGDKEFRESFFELTLSEVDRICALINELLAFARPAPAELQRVAVNDCLDRICLLLDSQARSAGVRLVRHLHAGALELTADEDQIKQVVINVILNAVQACGGRGTTKTGGSVVVSSYPNRLERGDYVCIEVSDDGIGIEPDAVDRIFDPFFTTRLEGTGLGLSIAHQIVSRHAGFIDVRSVPGKGTSFYVNLPAGPRVPPIVAIPGPLRELRMHG